MNKETIFVFANAISTIQSMSEKFNIEVIGTSSSASLMTQLQYANDTNKYFFVIISQEEINAVNNVFLKLSGEDLTSETFYLLINSKLKGKIKASKCGYYISEFDNLTSEVIKNNIIDVVIQSQAPYYRFIAEQQTPILNAEGVKKISDTMSDLETKGILEQIKRQYSGIYEKSKGDGISKLIVEISGGGKKEMEKQETPHFALDTQEFLKEKESEIKALLDSAKSKDDLANLLEILLGIFHLRSNDLNEFSKTLIDGVLEYEKSEAEKLKNEGEIALQEIEELLVDKSKKEVSELIAKRDEYLAKVEAMHSDVTIRVGTIQHTISQYALDFKGSTEVLKNDRFKGLVAKEQLVALSVTHKATGALVKDNVNMLIEKSQELITDLMTVADGYKKVTDLDTVALRTQGRLIDVLSTQKTSEKVVYDCALTAKLCLLVSPYPNIGASTVIRILSRKHPKILVLDFREITSESLDEFHKISYGQFAVQSLKEIAEHQRVFVDCVLGQGINEETLFSRLEKLEDEFDAICFIVDRYMTVLGLDKIQKIVYISDTQTKNLKQINDISSTYEPLFENLKKRMFILNKVTSKFKTNEELSKLLVIAGIDSTEVRINLVDYTPSLIEDEEGEYAALAEKFRVF